MVSPDPAAVAELFADITVKPRPLVIVTDEELAALADIVPKPQPPFPWLADHEDLPQHLAGLVGARSLAVRGLLTFNGDATRVDPALQLAIEAPTLARHLVSCERDDGTRAVWSVLPGLGVVEEVTTTAGFHGYTACTIPDAANRLAHWCLGDTRRAPTRPRSIALGSWPELAAAELGPDPVQISWEMWHDRKPAQWTWTLALDGSLALLCRAVDAERAMVEAVDLTSLSSTALGLML